MPPTRRARVPAEPSRGRTDELVAIAARLFVERGYDATSMQEIADEMGILKGSVYHYVRTKEDLLWMIVEPRLTELLENVRAIFDDHDLSVIERVRLALEAHVNRFELHYPYMFVISRETGATISPRRRKAYVALQESYYELWKAALAEGLETGELRPNIDISITVHGIFGMLSWMARWFRVGGPHTAQEVGDLFATIIANGIVADTKTVA